MKNHGNKLGVISAIALVAALPGRKITKEFLESEIIQIDYKRLGSKITHCTITTKSGFVFTGESACVDPADYNEDIGSKIAYDNAFHKMWMPYGFWLHKALTEIDYQSKLNEAQALIDSHSKRETTESGSALPETERLSFDDEPYQIKDTDQFTLELAIALAQNGDVVRNVNTGTTLSLDDCRHDAFWQLAQAPKAEDLPAVSAVNPIVYSQEHLRPPTMDFGYAVKMMKEGKRVSRIGWNGKGMFLYYVPENKYPASRNEHGTMIGVFENDMVPYGAYIAMKTAQNNVVPWLASQTDVLAEDWVITD